MYVPNEKFFFHNQTFPGRKVRPVNFDLEFDEIFGILSLYMLKAEKCPVYCTFPLRMYNDYTKGTQSSERINAQDSKWKSIDKNWEGQWGWGLFHMSML